MSVAPAARPNGDALAIVARYPEPGKVKTRLAATIGACQAAALYAAFLGDLAARFGAAHRTGNHAGNYELLWACAPGGRPCADLRAVVGGERRIIAQRGADFADRLYALACDTRDMGFERLVIMSSDSPHVPATVVTEAFAALALADVVLGPAEDGGYYLIGLHLRASAHALAPPDLFRGIQMSTSTVCAETLARAAALGLSTTLLAPTFDVDEAPDLTRLWDALRHADPALAPRTWLALSRLLPGVGSQMPFAKGRHLASVSKRSSQ